MLTLSINLAIGAFAGCLLSVLYLKKSQAKQIAILENSYHQQLTELEDANNTLNTEFTTVKSQANKQKEITIKKISEAFHAGSEMMEKIGIGLNRIQELVKNSSDPIQNIFESGSNAQSMIINSRNSMEKLATSLTELSDITNMINELCDHMNQVNAKTVVIHNIANQANLLSLNAAIEAARAGETGRGFSVVANDMNRLSELSATAAQEISQILASGLKSIDKITSQMESKITTFTNASNNVLGCFENMDGAINSISTLTESLNTDSKHTVNGVKNVSDTTQTTMKSLTKMLSDVSGIISGNNIADLSPRESHRKIVE